nr:RNA polymerase sigma-70 factor [Galbibacter mesophilus]
MSRNSKITADSYKDLFYNFYPRLLSFCQRYVSDTTIAEEIVEECMLYVWERRKDMNKVRDLKSYLYTMAKNKALAHIKQRDKIVSLDTQKYDSISEVDEFIIEEEVHSVLIEALDNLPEKCKNIFKLSCLEGLKYKDIAEDLNISVNTVKSQRSRAIALLKNHLKDHPSLAIYASILLKFPFF